MIQNQLHKYLTMFPVWLATVFVLPSCAQSNANKNSDHTLTISFWNMENFMDTVDGPGNDNDFTPTGSYNWNAEKYESKVANLAKVVNEIQPDILGVAEIENDAVLMDLIQNKSLATANYKFVHYESPDERGIDVALIYNASEVKIIQSEPIHVILPGNDATRDILHVTATVKNGDTLHVFVNHWPSRREGQQKSEAKRVVAAQTLKTFMEAHMTRIDRCVILGDFNDDPSDTSIRFVLQANSVANLGSSPNLVDLNTSITETNKGTLKFGNQWNMFDQIIITNPMYTGNTKLAYKANSFQIFSPSWLVQHDAKYEGFPLRTFGGKKWLNGYSDHFPVFAEFTYE